MRYFLTFSIPDQYSHKFIQSPDPTHLLIPSSPPPTLLSRALNLLSDPQLMFIKLSSSSPEAVPSVVRFAEQVKITRYRETGEELKTHVVEEDMWAKGGRRVIPLK
jgi:hypothetical protein